MDAYRSNVALKDRTAIGLARGNLLRLENACGMQVNVDQGLLWITQEGDACDVVLRGGESFRLDRDGVAILSACRPTALTLISLES